MEYCGYPFEKDKVAISAESLDPKGLEIVVFLMMKVSCVVDGKVHSFDHEDNWAELQSIPDGQVRLDVVTVGDACLHRSCVSEKKGSSIWYPVNATRYFWESGSHWVRLGGWCVSMFCSHLSQRSITIDTHTISRRKKAFIVNVNKRAREYH